MNYEEKSNLCLSKEMFVPKMLNIKLAKIKNLELKKKNNSIYLYF
jgi:hypothetical protein